MAMKLPPIEQLRSRTLGRVLIKMGLLTREKVHKCLTIQKKRHDGVQIGQIFLFGPPLTIIWSQLVIQH